MVEHVISSRRNQLSLGDDMIITESDQLFHLIEAQSTLKRWTGKNPIWLNSLANRSFSNSGSTNINIHTRIDYFRRAIQSEKDALHSSNSLGFFPLHIALTKDLLRTGNWNGALRSR